MNSSETSDNPVLPLPQKILREGMIIGLIAACVYLTLALTSYNQADPGWSSTGSGGAIQNVAGPTGAWIADVFLTLFGHLAYLFPLMLAYQVWQQLKDRSHWKLDWLIFTVRLVGLILVIVAACGIAVVQSGADSGVLPSSSGGWLGLSIASAVNGAFGYVGGLVILLSSLLFGLTIFVDISWIAVMDAIGAKVLLGLPLRCLAAAESKASTH